MILSGGSKLTELYRLQRGDSEEIKGNTVYKFQERRKKRKICRKQVKELVVNISKRKEKKERREPNYTAYILEREEERETGKETNRRQRCELLTMHKG